MGSCRRPPTWKVTWVFSGRVVGALIGVSVVVLTVSACSNPPSSAAQVGDVSISEAAIFDRSAALVQAQQTTGATVSPVAVAEVNRRQATAAIRGQLLDLAAADAGVQVSDSDVNAAVSGAGSATAAQQLGVPESVVPDAIRDLLRLEGLLKTLPAQGAPVTDVRVSVDGISVTTREDAIKTRNQFLADPVGVDALITASPKGLQRQPLTLLSTPGAGATGVFSAKVGDVILYPSQDGYLVLRVLDRSEEPALLTAADLQQQQISGAFDLGALLLAPYAQQVGVTVNPRLGAWDPNALQVVPGDGGL